MTCPWSWFTIAILYIFFDVNYFLRIAFTIGCGRLFQKKKKLFEATSIYGEIKNCLFILFSIGESTLPWDIFRFRIFSNYFSQVFQEIKITGRKSDNCVWKFLFRFVLILLHIKSASKKPLPWAIHLRLYKH